MNKKNTIGRTLRAGVLVTAAATLLMGNMAAFAAEGDEEEPAGFFWQEDYISGTVTEVGTDSITVRVSGAMQNEGFEMRMPGNGMQMGMPDGGQGMGMPQQGQRPPELPEGERPEFGEGELPEPPEGEGPEFGEGGLPEPPEGEGPEFGEGEPPELPEGIDSLMGGQPGGMPQGGQPGGMPQGGNGMGMPSMGSMQGSDIVVNVDDATVITKGLDSESATLSDVTEGSIVMVSLDGDTALSIMVLS